MSLTDQSQATAASNGFVETLRAQLGDDAVDVSWDSRAQYAVHGLPGDEHRPAGVVFPRSTEDVQRVVQCAAEHGVSVWPTSTGQQLGLGSFGPVREGQIVLHLGKRMNRILEVNQELGYAVLEPGVTFRQLRRALAEHGDSLMLSVISGPPDAGIVGNAMDRGAGYTPYFDHFGMTCGMEVVLPDGTLFRTGDGPLEGAKTWHISKYGFGPCLDGMFTQSNFGIVTKLGMWLMPRPPVIRSFFFTFPDDEDLAAIFEAIRPLKMSNAVPTLFKVTSSLYGIGTRMQYPLDRTDGVTPLPDSVRQELENEHATGAWIVSGAVYGHTEEVLDPMIERIKEHFGATEKATYISHEDALEDPILRIHIDTFSGEPTEDEIPIHRWRDGGGTTWFLPVTPMIGSVANAHQELSRRILQEFGFDYIVEFVCGPRMARALHCLSFNREDDDERERALACYRALVSAYDDAGYPAGRMPLDFQEEAMERLPALTHICGILKRALDPAGVIAPGKYGIE